MQYVLMHKEIPVLQMEIDESVGVIAALGEMHAPEHLPVGVPHQGGAADRRALNEWWTGRSIPASRSGLREALQTMGVSSPQLLLTKCCGLSLSDQYWVCPKGSGMEWGDVNFFDNPFSEDVGDILFGAAAGGAGFDLASPDNTSDGWLRKKWIIADGKRCLIKGGSGATRQEPYNEVLASAIMRRLGIPHAQYTLTSIDGYPYSVCEDFVTAETELVSAWHIMQTKKKPNHVSYYSHYLDCCAALGIPGMEGSLGRMLAVDFIIANEDRHFNNFGALRNAKTLEWIGASPIFDCGTSLWYSDPTPMIHPAARQPSKPFKNDHAEQIALAGPLGWIDFAALDGIGGELREIVSGSVFIDAARLDALCQALERRVVMLREFAESMPGR